jgi:AraC-like DNA-binding protein
MITEDDLTIHQYDFPNLWIWKSGIRICFIFPSQGSGLYTDENTSRPFSAGDVLVLTTGLKGTIRPTNEEKLKASMFYASIEHLVTVFPIGEFCLLEKALKTLAGPWFHPATGSIARKCFAMLKEAPRENNSEHRCHALRILSMVMAEQFKNKGNCTLPQAVSNSDSINNLSIEQIQRTTVAALARSYGYSRRHFNRLFHERFGISVSALKMELRLLKALPLLRNPVTKIASVADVCGFNHLSLFSARFKKRFGASPHEWRNKVLVLGPDYSLKNKREICPFQGQGFCPLSEQKNQEPNPKNWKALNPSL